MKSLLKKIKGGVKMVVGRGVLPIFAVTGLSFIGTLIAMDAALNKELDYKNSEVVQTQVEQVIENEKEELELSLQSGEISNSDYLNQSKELEGNSHKKNLTNQITNSVYGDDEQYQNVLKNKDQLLKATIGVGTVWAATFAYMVADWCKNVGNKIAESGEDDLIQARILKEEEEDKKQVAKRDKEIDMYSEEIID